MKTITNISSVADYSGELPTVVDSNPVTTVINEPDPIYCCDCCDIDCCCRRCIYYRRCCRCRCLSRCCRCQK